MEDSDVAMVALWVLAILAIATPFGIAALAYRAHTENGRWVEARAVSPSGGPIVLDTRTGRMLVVRLDLQ